MITVIGAKRTPRAIRKVSRTLRFPAPLWRAKYVSETQPELLKRGKRIIKAAWDAGLIEELHQLKWQQTENRPDSADPAKDDKWLEKRMRELAENAPLDIEGQVQRLTGQLWQASSTHAFSKLGIDAVWSLKSPTVSKAIEQRLNHITDVSATQFRELRSLIRNDVYGNGGSPVSKATLDRILQATGKQAQYQAERIARTETLTISGMSSDTVYLRNGVETYTWLWSGISRENHAAIDGEEIKAGETFSNGLRFPGDPDADISETANCGCDFAPGISSAIDPDEVVTE